MQNRIVRTAQAGFTLIELAIVMVIIGLLVGGVLVGQDLIKSATINAVISQLDRIDAGANTFRDKFGGLPGDLLAAKATQFGLTPTGGGGTGVGDGNGIIQNGGTAANQQGMGNETNVFWLHLGGAGAALIPDQGGNSTVGYGVPASAVTSGFNAYFPTTRLRDSSFIHVYAVNGRNFYYIGGFSNIATTGIVTITNAVTPIEAYNIDTKKDDGNGKNGTVLAVSDITTNAVIAAGSGSSATECFTATQGTYDTGATAGGGLNCALSVRTSF